MITRIDTGRCTGCGICIDRCNMDVLRLDSVAGKAFIAYHEDCMTCFECVLSCPEDAVEVRYTPEFTPSSIVYPEGKQKT